jgi:hypothetical protein
VICEINITVIRFVLYFEIGLLPSAVPAFTDSATNLNPEYEALVPQLQGEFPDAVIHLSDWGPDYDDIICEPVEVWDHQHD